MRRFGVLLLTLLTFGTAIAAPAAADEPVIAAKPPMGISWSRGWNQCPRIDDAKVRAAVDMLVTSGLKDAGYSYVNIAGCWAAKTRAADGKLQPDTAKYPDLPGLIAYVHANGLKFGLHSGTGALVCGSAMPGSRDHEELDAQTFAAWGVDYLEYDTCGGQTGVAAAVKKMSDALKATGRPITLAMIDTFSANYRQWEWAPGAGAHTWQLTSDLPEPFAAVMTQVDRQIPLAGHTGPGGWSDPGYLNFSFLDLPVRRAEFSLWALLVVRATRVPSPARFALAGAGVALLALIRPGNAVLLAFAVFPFVLPGDRRQRLTRAGAFLLAGLIPLVAWAVLNGVRFGDYALARGGNAVIPFYRAFITDKIVSPENGPASRRLGDAVRRHLVTREPYKSYDVTVARYTPLSLAPLVSPKFVPPWNM